MNINKLVESHLYESKYDYDLISIYSYLDDDVKSHGRADYNNLINSLSHISKELNIKLYNKNETENCVLNYIKKNKISVGQNSLYDRYFRTAAKIAYKILQDKLGVELSKYINSSDGTLIDSFISY
jgi:hypothetical protein